MPNPASLSRMLHRVASVEDFKRLCERRLPRPVFEFIEGAAFRERTRAANIDDFATLRFRQRVLRDVSGRTLEARLLGQDVTMPVAIAPTGMTGMVSGDGKGELHMARAARAAGVPYTLGMLSLRSMEEVADVAGPPWFQLCLLRDRSIAEGLVARAKAVECPVLVVTVTWPLPSRMNRAIRNPSATVPGQMRVATMLQYAARPFWALRAIRAGAPELRNMTPHMGAGADGVAVVRQLDARADWDAMAWLRDLWPGKLVIKGVTNAGEVEEAVRLGIDGVSVSNHGGNQLDEARSTIAALPEVAAAAAGRIELLLDGGVRTGQDVLKALALGAKGCLLGRAPLYALAAAGEAGVSRFLALLRAELDVSMGLTGLRAVSEASPAILTVAGVDLTAARLGNA